MKTRLGVLIPFWLALGCLGGAFAAPATTASPAGGVFNTAQSVTLGCTDASGPGCRNTYYSIDGNPPGGTITIVDAAYGTPAFYNPATHTFLRNVPACTASSSSKTVMQSACNGRSSCSVSASSAVFGDPCMGVYKRLYVVYQCAGQYLFLNADETTNANLACHGATYTGPINIGANTTLMFFSEDLAGNREGLRTETYALDFGPPTTTPSPAGGYYTAPQTVTLTCADAGAGCQTTYYCFGAGCTPATVYGGTGLGISALARLRYYSVDGVGNAESVKQTDYLVANPASMRLTPSSLDAGRLPVGAAGVVQAVTLTNAGDLALAIPAIPTAAGDFVVNHDCPANLAAGMQCALSVVFRPTQAGVRAATLAIGSQSVSLTGSGTIVADSLLVDPAEATTLYAGLDGAGVYVSGNGGGSWGPASIQPTHLAVRALARKSGAPLYAGTFGGGVFKAAAGTTAFVACTALPASQNVLSLTLDAANTLYAGTEAGVFASSDQCASWSAMNTGLPN